jgi:hypothetical protein
MAIFSRDSSENHMIEFTQSKNPLIFWAKGPLSDYSKTIQSQIKELEEKESARAWERVYNCYDYIYIKFSNFNFITKMFPTISPDFRVGIENGHITSVKFSLTGELRGEHNPHKRCRNFASYDEDSYSDGWSKEEEMDYYGYEGPRNDSVAYENWRDIQN